MDLALAGALSGGGNAATVGLQTITSGLVAEGLQDKRDAMEMRRMQLQQEFLEKRDTTNYTRGRADLADARAYEKGREQEVYDTGREREQATYEKGRTRKVGEAAEDLETRKGMIHAKAGVDMAEFEANKPLARAKGLETVQAESELVGPKAALGRQTFDANKGLRKDTAIEDVTIEVTKATMLAENKAWLKAQMILANAKESSASRAQAAKTMWEIEQGKQGAGLRDKYVALTSDPNADPVQIQKAREAWSAYAMKPGESEKIDATNAAAGMREAGNEIVRLQGMMKDQIPGTPEYAALGRRLSTAESAHEAFTARVKELTGTKTQVKPKLEIKDRFKADAKVGDTSAQDNKEASDLTKEQLRKELPPAKKQGMIYGRRSMPVDLSAFDLSNVGGSINGGRNKRPPE
ncbi:MAG: hypothetical protein ABIU97_07340 [Dehalococcoidia bacterium]